MRRVLFLVGFFVLSATLAACTSASPPPTTSADTFDIDRFSPTPAGTFETFYVTETQPLEQALDAGTVTADTKVMVTETARGKLALLTDQMAYHHIAQGTADGQDWMVTF